MREFLQFVHNLAFAFALALISLYRIQKWISTSRMISMLSCFGLCRLLQAWMDSSLSDPCLSIAHYGTTEVTINYQSVYGKNWILLSVWKSDLTTILHWRLCLPMTIGRLCRHTSRPPIRSIIASYCVQSVWIQWTTEFRVTLLLNSVRNPRVGLAGTLSRSLVQSADIAWQQLQYVWIETKLQF